MSTRIMFILILCSTLLALLFLIVHNQSQPLFISYVSDSSSADSNINTPRILLSCLSGKEFGGGEVHGISVYNELSSHKYPVIPLVQEGSSFKDYLDKNHIPHYLINVGMFNHLLRPLYHIILQRYLYNVCAKENIHILQINARSDIPDATYVKKYLPVKVFYIHHSPYPLHAHQIKNVDAIVTVNKYLLAGFEQENKNYNLGIHAIIYAPPFFNAGKFQTYLPTESKADFFNKNFKIAINQNPLITMNANFYSDRSHKNHALLLEAARILIYEKNKPISIMFAGKGPSKSALEKLSTNLKLNKFVHFLGFTDNIAGLLYHSDVFVLASSKEAFGIVYLEAGLMKKPAIGALGTGAEAIIINEKTGLLFKNNDAQDLANQIERLIDNLEWAQELGNNAHNHIMKNFSPEVTFTKYEEIYQQLMDLK